MRFFVGLHQPSDAQHFAACFVSINRLRKRKGPFKVRDWMMDCAGFTELSRHGDYRHSPEEYAEEIKRWKGNGNLLAAVSQDFMCEPFILARTGLTIPDHQIMTIGRYDALVETDTGVYIMPVLQGYSPDDYVSHIRQYRKRLTYGMWVGVGSVCKRNSSPCLILDVLIAIKTERPDLRLHGFGLKTTALAHGTIRALLESADSMAWSFAARKQGRNGNSWEEAEAFRQTVGRLREYQSHLIEEMIAGREGVLNAG